MWCCFIFFFWCCFLGGGCGGGGGVWGGYHYNIRGVVGYAVGGGRRGGHGRIGAAPVEQRL
ncbi:hypothetical protein PUR28_10960, partial [Streptomyces sp. BE308]|uniref:hypothetical protein n=1 Tax=Streptomyces sp. BE308 TaxID=3002529 RepID=UPI002E77D9FF